MKRKRKMAEKKDAKKMKKICKSGEKNVENKKGHEKNDKKSK